MTLLNGEMLNKLHELPRRSNSVFYIYVKIEWGIKQTNWHSLQSLQSTVHQKANYPKCTHPHIGATPTKYNTHSAAFLVIHQMKWLTWPQTVENKMKHKGLSKPVSVSAISSILPPFDGYSLFNGQWLETWWEQQLHPYLSEERKPSTFIHNLHGFHGRGLERIRNCSALWTSGWWRQDLALG